MQVYLVGGAVRDTLLGLPVTERDWVVVGASPEALIAEGFRPVGAEFPVFLHPATHEEYALARTERKTGHGYKGFTFYTAPTVTLEEDLERRDLTINAMAQSPAGDIIDPYGGQRDLAARVLRHVSPAFSEDPVRILRLARFYARFKSLGFHIAAETMTYMRAQVTAGEVGHLVKERIWQEMQRALAEPHPEAFFEVLNEVGALSVLCPMLPPNPHWPALVALRKEDADPMHRWVAWVYSVTRASSDAATCAQTLCAHLGVPKEYRELAVLFVRYYPALLKLQSQPADMWVQWLEQVDAFRRQARYSAFLEIAGHIGSIGKWLTQLHCVQIACAEPIALPGNIDSTAVRAYIRAIRLERAKEILAKTVG